MDTGTGQAKADPIDAVLEMIQARVATVERSLLELFAREYFVQVDPEMLVSAAVDDLYGAVLSHWQFARRRAPSTPRVRVLSPTIAEHGWASRHTILEIVNDDMPFLVDSVSIEVNRQGLALHLIIHPVLAIERDHDGEIIAIRSRLQAQGAPLESVMHLEVDRMVDPAACAQLAVGVERVLGDVRAAVEDWPRMVERLHEAAAELAAVPAAVSRQEAEESRVFLEWLADDHFVLLGYRRHDLIEEDDGAGGVSMKLRLVAGSGLGILREHGAESTSASFASLPSKARALARAPAPILITTKANSRATVHRSSYIDYVGVKRFAADGAVIGEHRFLGLYTSSAYSSRVSEVPLLRGRVAAVEARAGFAHDSFLGKALHHILETYPRDELMQIGAGELFETALGILQLGERHGFRLFLRRDPFDRFVSCLIYVPRESYSTELRRRFIDILTATFAGQGVDFEVMMSDSMLARIHITVRTDPGHVPEFDQRELQKRLAAASRRWDDDLRDALIAEEGEARGIELFQRWSGGFPASYREGVSGRAAVADVRRIDALTPDQPVALHLYRPLEGAPDRFGFKLCHLGTPVVLSESLPMLERMGVRVLAENPYRIAPPSTGGSPVWIHDFELQAAASEDVEAGQIAGLFERAFARVFDGRVENDDFNRLVLRAGLAAEDIVIARAYAKYLRQIGFGLSQSFIEATLAAHPRITHMWINLFKLRFDPGLGAEIADRADTVQRQARAIEQALDKVTSLNEDRVLRQLLALVMATQRTNFWRTDAGGKPREFLSFKLDPAKVPGLPLPRPMFEIFVYSPRFEGVHLRGGRVARGGLRWSDRPEDFRTEILGLVKAQIVKNAVIVPTGSKGGFVLKKAPPASDREAFQKEGVACYQDYLRGLLDLTDNLVGGQVVRPPQVVRHDPDDPYLVVAADKGTATFSDFANAISREYRFWLDDAFASGGSAGYDHKKMGITARGAWESVKRHFLEQGLDTQSTDFTVVGIGDMSGDVFGNGMLLSYHIHLLAAFDHRHIFIDPNPDAAKSFDERRRMFELPRSSWADYDASRISPGGGVWSRSVKSVPISPQARAALGIEAESLTPTELVSAILKAPVDLLYNGGIGTYVKSSRETHPMVGDRANDVLRVDGRDLRCRAVAEGGNLGFTQLGRIEYALVGCGGSGGRIYTDAIDNSAGVDTSDHEVNIKILLGLAIADGELTEKQRNQLLTEMTDDVAALVLRDNKFQTQSLSLTQHLGAKRLEQQARFLRFLERAGRIDRTLEFLPSDDEIVERGAHHTGLTGPELAVLLAYAKIWLFDELIGSDLPEDPWIAAALERYFPPLIRARYGELMKHHPLKREIVVTHVVNSMINRVGSTFVHQQIEITGATPAQVVRAYLLARQVFGQVATWEAIDALGHEVPIQIQAEMLAEIARLGTRATTWFLRSRRLTDPMADTIARLAPAVELLLPLVADGAGAAWIDAGVPTALAVRIAASGGLFAALDIADIAESTGRALADVAAVHLAVGDRLGLPRVGARIAQAPAVGHWHALAKFALADDLADLHRAIAADATRSLDTIREGSAAGAHALLAPWESRHRGELEHFCRLLDELNAGRDADIAMLSVVLHELRRLT
jgi:glutamate dehydrogenase